ncbi:hypothetical protein M408DRAFT_60998 [Serendipita vermifera MAFF 305830]|uniref:Heme haloperoxidase family profile domain-containing protein n=1 Tax=Serendipita vermifera MAFF 305830 TaxID=933852 RepID=A0A0C3B9W6_SERVB|nr:hypothetical protein M408DRAFT_60998 [Serendipita vermifera MAFF 305830]
MVSTSHPHEYIPAQEGFGRSPCPALNALANHGYLPRDGKNISIPQLVKALTGVYNLSYPLAFALASLGVILCGHGLYLDLEGLRKHNVIEHDASMVRITSNRDRSYPTFP